jgi:beta-ribofuranosylaminobenzene 5'-phosphate synthase
LKLVVRAPGRLHLGFIDLHGGCGRLFGSLGVAIENPAYVLEARRSNRNEAAGAAATEVLDIMARLGSRLPAGMELSINVREAIPRHRGFGSGTQLELSIAFIMARLLGRRVPGVRGGPGRPGRFTRELARRTNRGKRSGIGVATFGRGGFVVDAGKTRHHAVPADPPPVIFQRALPADWRFVIVTPRGRPGLDGTREERLFAELPPMNEEAVGRISRLTLMKILPGVITDDISAFGEGISEIQELVGNHFAPYQGGVYATETGRLATELARKRGAYAVGQSSWGPTVFALVRGDDQAGEMTNAIRRCLGQQSEAVFSTRPSNRGVEWWMER